MVGLQRRPILGDSWRSALVLEQRMFRAIDAVAAMGPVATAYVERWAMDAPAKDPTRVFSVAMAMGCFAGHDALGVIERVFLEYQTIDPSCAEELAAALKLVPHPKVALWLRSWLSDPQPQHRAMAIDVLGHRGLATEAELGQATADTSMVAAKAWPYLARVAPAAARDLLRHCSGDESEASGPLQQARWLAMALAGVPDLSPFLQAELEGANGDEAAMLLALGGDQHDAQALIDSLRRKPTLGRVAAVGWAGSAAAFVPLIEMLEHDDEALRIAAAEALERLSNAGLREEVEVDIEDIFVPEPPDPDLGEPKELRLVRMTSDPRDLPPDPSPETITRPSTHPAVWRAWYEQEASRWPLGRRYRMGQLYTPQVSLWELDRALRSPSERRLLLDELIIRSGAYERMDPHDLVTVQLKALEQWSGSVRQAESQAGDWGRKLRR